MCKIPQFDQPAVKRNKWEPSYTYIFVYCKTLYIAINGKLNCLNIAFEKMGL